MMTRKSIRDKIHHIAGYMLTICAEKEGHLTDDMPLREINSCIDELDIEGLISEIEETFNIIIDEDQLPLFCCINDLVSAVEKAMYHAKQ